MKTVIKLTLESTKGTSQEEWAYHRKMLIINIKNITINPFYTISISEDLQTEMNVLLENKK